MPDNQAARIECFAKGNIWLAGECLTPEQARERIAEIDCLINRGQWVDGKCVPSIAAADLTGSTEGLSPGQFAVGWGQLPPGTATVNVYYQAVGGRAHRIYEGIKADFPPPIIVSGQRKGVTVVWHVEAFNEWGTRLGYSNEVTTITK